MVVNFYATHYLSCQTWADNYEETRDKENLKQYQGNVLESYTATNGDLIHFVEYEKGNILVQNKDLL